MKNFEMVSKCPVCQSELIDEHYYMDCPIKFDQFLYDRSKYSFFLIWRFQIDQYNVIIGKSDACLRYVISKKSADFSKNANSISFDMHCYEVPFDFSDLDQCVKRIQTLIIFS